MLELLKQGTGCEIIIGKNGRVWARNGNLALLKKIVLFINDNSYKSNLTNAVEEFFKAEGIAVNVPKKEIVNNQKNNLKEESEVMQNNSEEESELLN
jgi:exosome complex component RRP4